MGRLINTSTLNNVVMKRKTEYGRLATLIDNIVEEMVMETPTADAILIPKGATNGDIIKAMFSVETVDDFHGSVGVRLNNSNYVQFNKDWWNEAYIPQK